MNIPNLYEGLEPGDPECFVKIVRDDGSDYDLGMFAWIVDERGNILPGGYLLDENCERIPNVNRDFARRAGVTLDENDSWDVDQCIQTLAIVAMDRGC